MRTQGEVLRWDRTDYGQGKWSQYVVALRWDAAWGLVVENHGGLLFPGTTQGKGGGPLQLMPLAQWSLSPFLPSLEELQHSIYAIVIQGAASPGHL